MLATALARRVLVAGEGYLGALGTGGVDDIGTFTALTGADGAPLRAVSAAAGWAHSAAVDGEGRVFMWGRSHEVAAPLGLHRLPRFVARAATSVSAALEPAEGTAALRLSPTLLPLPAGAAAAVGVTCGAGLTAVLTADGGVYTMGEDTHGQCGHGSDKADAQKGLRQYAPKRLAGEVGGLAVARVSLGFQHGLALTADARLFAWGKNGRGQLGPGDDAVVPTPAELRFPGGAAAAAAGLAHSAAATRDGALYVWGKMHGDAVAKRRGMNSSIDIWEDAFEPRRLALGPGLEGRRVVDVAAGGYVTAALLDDGSLAACGMDTATGTMCAAALLAAPRGDRGPAARVVSGVNAPVVFLGEGDAASPHAVGIRDGAPTLTPLDGPYAGAVADVSLGWQHGVALARE